MGTLGIRITELTDVIVDFVLYFTNMCSRLAEGMVVSIQIFFCTLFFSLLLGIFVAFGRMSKHFIVRFPTKVFISIMRGTPLMLQLLVIYFGPWFLFEMKISSGYKMTAVLIGFAINYAAYFAEIYRAGIESIPVGQYEAAKLLGYNKLQTFIYIVMPQVIKRIVPPVANETITLVKDTSLAYTLSVIEMFSLTKQIAAAETSMLPFVVAGIFYYIFNLVVAVTFEYLEKKLGYYR